MALTYEHKLVILLSHNAFPRQDPTKHVISYIKHNKLIFKTKDVSPYNIIILVKHESLQDSKKKHIEDYLFRVVCK